MVTNKTSGWPWRMVHLPNGSVWPCRRTKKERKTEEEGSYQTAQVGLGDRGRMKSKKYIGFNLDCNRIFKNSRNESARPVMGTIFTRAERSEARVMCLCTYFIPTHPKILYETLLYIFCVCNIVEERKTIPIVCHEHV